MQEAIIEAKKAAEEHPAAAAAYTALQKVADEAAANATEALDGLASAEANVAQLEQALAAAEHAAAEIQRLAMEHVTMGTTLATFQQAWGEFVDPAAAHDSTLIEEICASDTWYSQCLASSCFKGGRPVQKLIEDLTDGSVHPLMHKDMVLQVAKAWTRCPEGRP